MQMRQRKIYQQPDLPVFQNRLYKTSEEARNSPTGDILLIENNETGLIYNNAFNSTLLNYDASYNNEQSYSATFKEHMVKIASLIEKTMGNEKLIEIGCGKGTFLELLMSRGSEIIGFDPTYEGSNQMISKEYFNKNTKAKGNGIILRHVLEHIQKPVDFLHSLSKTNGGNGLIYIEVPCFDWIINNKAWFDIFYEHVNYFRLTDFSRIFSKIIYADRVFGGQYLSIVADLSSLDYPKFNSDEAIKFPPDFCKTLIPKNFSSDNKNIILWGGGSKGVIFSLLLERSGVPVNRVIDINPNKQGLYLPGTGIKIMSPEEGLKNLPPKSEIYVMNPNYLDEVQAMSGKDFLCKVLDYG